MVVGSRPGSGLCAPANEFDNLAGGGVAFQALLGKNHISVHGDLEHTTGGLRQANFAVGIRLLQLGGQTGRPGLVVSDYAELDCYFHAFTSLTGVVSRANRSLSTAPCQAPVLPCLTRGYHLTGTLGRAMASTRPHSLHQVQV